MDILFILIGFAIPIEIGAVIQGILLLFGIKLNGDGFPPPSTL